MSDLVSGRWAASFPVTAARAVARLRIETGIDAAIDGDTLWLRGERSDDATIAALMRVAPVDLYSVEGDGVISRRGDRLPHGRLPAVTWTPIARFVQVTMPPSMLSGALKDSVSLTLIASNQPRPANGLLTSLDQFASWADDAPDFRFRPLRYAVSRDQVLILGEPTPSIAGVRLYETEGICVPCGFEIAPPVDAKTLRVILGLAAMDVALFEMDAWHLIPGDVLIPVSRSSVRLTAKRRAS